MTSPLVEIFNALEPNAIAVVAVADGPDRDFEVEVAVRQIRIDLAQIPGLARGAQQRTGDPQLQQALSGDDPDVSRPAEVLREALELAPVSKLLYASDAARTPELYYLGAKWWRASIAGSFSSALGLLYAGDATNRWMAMFRIGSGLNPRRTCASDVKVRMNRPAPTTSTSESAT